MALYSLSLLTHPLTFCVCVCVCVCQADKDSMRSLGSSPGYEVTFTLMNPQPDVVSVTWDVQSAVDSEYNQHHHHRIT